MRWRGGWSRRCKPPLTLRAGQPIWQTMARAPLLQLTDISLTFGGTPLFEGVSAQVQPGDRIALVAQDTYLFNGTLEANIRLARPDASAAEVERALADAALAALDLPIRVTEFNFPGQRSKYYQQRPLQLSPEEEAAKADALRRYFRICFAHPAVTGILLWGFWEGANWIPQSSLYRRDWTPTPAAEAYRRLVFSEWWTRTAAKADSQGLAAVRVFFGTHRIRAAGRESTVTLLRREGAKMVDLP